MSAMTRVMFYHLTADPPESILPALLVRALGAGLRVALRGGDLARVEALDRALWLAEGFLPHGLDGGPHDAAQPILLCRTPVRAADLANGARCLVALDGAPVDPAELSALDRAMILFDGMNPAMLETARGQWRALTAAGAQAEYWRREDGRWICAARHPRA